MKNSKPWLVECMNPMGRPMFVSFATQKERREWMAKQIDLRVVSLSSPQVVIDETDPLVISIRAALQEGK